MPPRASSVADQGDHQDAVHQADQPQVDLHVAVDDVAELVGDHPLQLVARELGHRAAGDPDHRFGRREAGGEGVDLLLLVEQENRRHRHPGGQRHLLDHVEQLALVAVGAVGLQLAAAQQAGDRPAALVERQGLVDAADQDDAEHHEGDPEGQHRLEEAGLGRHPLPGVGRGDPDQGVDRGDGGEHRQREEEDQLPGLFPGGVLMAEEVHRQDRVR